MNRPQDRSGRGRVPVLVRLLLLVGAGLTGAALAVVVYLRLVLPAELEQHPWWWFLAAAAPVVALACAWSTTGPVQGAVLLRRAATLTACAAGAALVVLVAFGKSLDASAPASSGLAAVSAGILATFAAVPFLRGQRSRGRTGSAAGRGRPRAGRTGHRPPRSQAVPRPGEIWWGVVPFREGDGSTDRPILVLDVQNRRVTALPITSNDYSHREDYLAFRPDTAASDLAPGWVELRPCTIDLSRLRHRAATACPPALWRKVQARVGPKASSRRPGAPARPTARQGRGRRLA